MQQGQPAVRVANCPNVSAVSSAVCTVVLSAFTCSQALCGTRCPYGVPLACQVCVHMFRKLLKASKAGGPVPALGSPSSPAPLLEGAPGASQGLQQVGWGRGPLPYASPPGGCEEGQEERRGGGRRRQVEEGPGSPSVRSPGGKGGPEPHTVVKEMFGGVLQSEIRCLRCRGESVTRDAIMDLCLDVHRLTSLRDALQRFSRPEILDGENKYRCEKCNELSAARKALTVLEAPNVLVVQFKVSLRRQLPGHTIRSCWSCRCNVSMPSRRDRTTTSTHKRYPADCGAVQCSAVQVNVSLSLSLWAATAEWQCYKPPAGLSRSRPVPCEPGA